MICDDYYVVGNWAFWGVEKIGTVIFLSKYMSMVRLLVNVFDSNHSSFFRVFKEYECDRLLQDPMMEASATIRSFPRPVTGAQEAQAHLNVTGIVPTRSFHSRTNTQVNFSEYP